jgi:NitT/TauT family transport system substrate-binding protein
MRFSLLGRPGILHSYPLRIGGLAIGWLLLIAGAHYSLNVDHDQRPVVTMGYMPVITNLAAPLLDYASISNKSPIRYRALKFSSFAEMAEALRNEEIQAAFIIAPLAIVLRQQGEDVKVVYIGNRHESTLVVRKDLHAHTLAELAGRTIAVPMRYSGHNLLLLKLLSENGLDGKINVVEMNPPDMASALTSGSLDAYFVGEPFAAQTLRTGASNLFFRVEDVAPDFICNLLLVQNRFIKQHPEAVRQMVQGAVRSGLWARQNLVEAAQIASDYWGQPKELVRYAFSTPANRIVFDKYLPVEEELQEMADLMVRFKLLETGTIQGLIEDRFARQADTSGIGAVDSILITSENGCSQPISRRIP